MTASEQNVRAVVVDALVGMVSGVTGMVPPTDTPLPDFIQGPVDRAVSKIEAVRTADRARIAALENALSDIAGRHHHSASAGEYFAQVARAALAQQGKEQTQ